MKRKRTLITVFIGIGIVFLALAALIGGLVWKTRYASRAVLSSLSPDASYALTVYQIGDADFPFGATHCRGELRQGQTVLRQISFDVQNDGKTVDETNFRVRWQDGCVSLDVSGEEMETVTYNLSFGETSSRP